MRMPYSFLGGDDFFAVVESARGQTGAASSAGGTAGTGSNWALQSSNWRDACPAGLWNGVSLDWAMLLVPSGQSAGLSTAPQFRGRAFFKGNRRRGRRSGSPRTAGTARAVFTAQGVERDRQFSSWRSSSPRGSSSPSKNTAVGPASSSESSSSGASPLLPVRWNAGAARKARRNPSLPGP